MNCTTCPAAERIAELIAAHAGGKPLTEEIEREIADARARCLRCDPDAVNHKGVSHVSFDAAAAFVGGEVKIASEYTAARCSRCDMLTPLSPAAESACLELLARIAELDVYGITVMWGLLRGMRVAELARVLKLSRPCAHARLTTAIKRAPWLASVYTKGHKLGVRALR